MEEEVKDKKILIIGVIVLLVIITIISVFVVVSKTKKQSNTEENSAITYMYEKYAFKPKLDVVDKRVVYQFLLKDNYTIENTNLIVSTSSTNSNSDYAIYKIEGEDIYYDNYTEVQIADILEVEFAKYLKDTDIVKIYVTPSSEIVYDKDMKYADISTYKYSNIEINVGVSSSSYEDADAIFKSRVFDLYDLQKELSKITKGNCTMNIAFGDITNEEVKNRIVNKYSYVDNTFTSVIDTEYLYDYLYIKETEVASVEDFMNYYEQAISSVEDQ